MSGQELPLLLYKNHGKDKSKPFFLYIGLTQIHPPMMVHPDFAGKSTARGGIYADIIGEIDAWARSSMRLKTPASRTTPSSCSAATMPPAVVLGGGSSNGPWHGNFFTPPFEGSYRVPAMIRWPGKVPAGVVSNEVLAAEDWMPTLAGLAGEA